MRSSARLHLTAFLAALAAPAGCDWAAADGPWNVDDPEPSPSFRASMQGLVCAPDGERGVAAAELIFRDADEQELQRTWTDSAGAWRLEDLPPDLYLLEARSGLLSARGAVRVRTGSVEQRAADLCLDGGAFDVLVLRDERDAPDDRLDARLRALGLDHVQAGPAEASAAADLFATPQGLADYGLLAVAGGLDVEPLLAHDRAMEGLRDFLDDGGAIVVTRDAWPLAEALVPGIVEPVPETPSQTRTFAEVLVPDALAGLDWPVVALPWGADRAMLRAGTAGEALLRAELLTAGGDRVDVHPLVRSREGAGRVLVVAFPLPLRDGDEWWQGDPAPRAGVDGWWDGRGAAFDRAVLRLGEGTGPD